MSFIYQDNLENCEKHLWKTKKGPLNDCLLLGVSSMKHIEQTNNMSKALNCDFFSCTSHDDYNATKNIFKLSEGHVFGTLSSNSSFSFTPYFQHLLLLVTFFSLIFNWIRSKSILTLVERIKMESPAERFPMVLTIFHCLDLVLYEMNPLYEIMKVEWLIRKWPIAHIYKGLTITIPKVIIKKKVPPLKEVSVCWIEADCFWFGAMGNVPNQAILTF